MLDRKCWGSEYNWSRPDFATYYVGKGEVHKGNKLKVAIQVFVLLKRLQSNRIVIDTISANMEVTC